MNEATSHPPPLHSQGGPPAIGQLWSQCVGQQPVSSRGQDEQFFPGKDRLFSDQAHSLSIGRGSAAEGISKLTALVKIQNSLQVPLQSLSTATTDEEIDAYLSDDDVSPKIALHGCWPWSFDEKYPLSRQPAI